MKKRVLIALVVVLALAATASLVWADGITIDGILSAGEWDSCFWFTDNSEGPGTGYDDDPLPVFTGYLCFDESNLYLAFDVEDTTPNTNRDFLYVTIDTPPAGVFNDPVDALYWGSIPANASFFGEAYLTGGVFPWDRSQRGSTWGPDGGVVTARTMTATNRYYELMIPLSAIGASSGDTIGLKIQARGGQYTSQTDPQVVNFFPDMPDGITPIRADTRVEVEGNFCQVTLAPQPKEAKQGVIDDLSSLLSTPDKKTDDRIEKAIDEINKSLDPDLWENGSTLTKKGKKVFEEEKKAVHELMKIVKDGGPVAGDAQAAIDALVSADEALAQTAIDEAIAGTGDVKKIAKAQKEMDKALEEIGKGKYDKAIEHYKKAWEHAQKAMK